MSSVASPVGHSETLTVRAVSKAFGAQQVLDEVDLEVAPGEFFTLLGPSGCGKTTLLRIIAGLESADTGNVHIGDRDITAEPPERRPFNMVFQSYALFPHMSVAENVAYGLRVGGVGKAEMRQRVSQALDVVDLPHLRDRDIAQLSGGQRQRVALARALINEPTVLLLDEPLGALDLQLRKRLQEELRATQQRVGTTFIYVTHDQEEALSMSDRIAVMRHGQFAQIGSPEDIYRSPRTPYVAEFIGETNLLTGELLDSGSAVRVQLADGPVVQAVAPHGHGAPGDSTTVAVRPEHLRFVATGESGIDGQIRQVTYLGSVRRYRIALNDGVEIRVTQPADEPAQSGAVRVAIAESGAVALTPDVSG